MNFFSTLRADLRDRQILPAVVVLAVLVVAIPLVASFALSGVSTTPPPPVAPVNVKLAKGVAPPAQELDVLSTPPPLQYHTGRGSEPNPFREGSGASAGGAAKVSTSSGSSTPSSTSAPKTTTTPTTTTPKVTTPPKTTTAPKSTKPTKTPSSSKPSSGTTPSSGSKTSKPNPLATAMPTIGPASLSSDQAYVVNIDTKDAKGTHALTNVVRLAPLPAAQSPELIYLGVLNGGKKAAFLFTNAVKVSAQGGSSLTCLPSNDDCQIVELSPGQGMSLAPTSNTALIATFTFELMSISAQTFPSAGDALAARDAVSATGQTLLPLSASTALATLRFDDKIGALVKQSPPTAGSTGTTGSTGSTGGGGSSQMGNTERFPRGITFTLRAAR